MKSGQPVDERVVELRQVRRLEVGFDPFRPQRVDQALDHLRFIRNTMENAGSFTAVPGIGGMLVGATAFFAAFAAHLSAGPRAWLAIWIGEALLALAIGIGFSARKARLGGSALLLALFLPRGIWGVVEDRLHLQLLPVGYRLRFRRAKDPPPAPRLRPADTADSA